MLVAWGDRAPLEHSLELVHRHMDMFVYIHTVVSVKVIGHFGVSWASVSLVKLSNYSQNFIKFTVYQKLLLHLPHLACFVLALTRESVIYM